MRNALLAGLLWVGFCLLVAAVTPLEWRRRLCLAFARTCKRNPAGSLAGLAVLVVAARLCCLPVLPKPVPTIADEHSNLLLARTLAAGRFSNPVHPMWRHFETLFVLQRPAYASVYPPVQGVILASGLLVFNQPWAGVLASIALMCVTVVWMLRAYTTRVWALYGGVLAGVGLGVFSYWANTYWGGAGAAIGGALVFGSLPRLLLADRRRYAAILGVGLVVLANSRPFEGLLAAIPVAFWVACNFRRLSWRQMAALGCVILAGGIFTGWYNSRVTGSPFRLPHAAYMEQYAAAPAFIWQSPRKAPEYGDRVLRDAHVSFGIDYAEYSTFLGGAGRSFRKIAGMTTFYWGPGWAIALLSFPEFARERRFRVVLISLALCGTGILLTVGFQLHYAAPCTSILLLMLVDALRRVCRRWKRVGAVLVIAAPPAWLGWQGLHLLGTHPPNSLRLRPAAGERISAEAGPHLVFVHYSPLHPLGEEWVYNEPDIDGSRVVWARDLGRQANRKLVQYYSQRTVWLVEPDHPIPRITRCEPECAVPEDGRVSPMYGPAHLPTTTR